MIALRLIAVPAVLALVVGFVGACAKAPPPVNHDWVIGTRIVFVEKDLKTARQALPRESFRLWLPYIAGDLYGAPTTGDYLNANVAADYSTTIDLNVAHDALLASLEETAFGLSGLAIEPKEARIARLAPQLVQADGIEQIGTAELLDKQTGERLMLLYFDRPAVIKGHIVGRDGAALDYQIRCDHAGYQWVTILADGADTRFSAISWPRSPVIAVTP